MLDIARLAEVGWAAAMLLAAAARERVHGVAPGKSGLPQRLRVALERLGPVYVKIGQALSLRRDLFPDSNLEALRDLRANVPPFPAQAATQEIEIALGRPVKTLFAGFEYRPIAAGSSAQVHCARLLDGRDVAVKIRRSGARAQIERDFRALLGVSRLAAFLVPRLRRLRLDRLLEELATNLRRETDFRQEARNTLRLADGLRDMPSIFVPRALDQLWSEAVLVQKGSGGRPITDVAVRAEAPRLAHVLLDAYLRQVFVFGVFHADPHPGNLFVMEDGRLCLHDLGLVGELDRAARRDLGLFLLAFAQRDADWMLDAAIALGLLGGSLERAEFRRGIDAVLAELSALPVSELSIAEAVLRVARLGSGENFVLPHELAVQMRTIFLLVSTLRELDPSFRIFDALLAHGEDELGALVRAGARGGAGSSTRLRHEITLVAEALPKAAAAWLGRARRGRALPAVPLRIEGVERMAERLDRAGNRLAVAVVTLGLYVAASLLMLHGAGPRAFGDVPPFALLLYAPAIWFSLRLARAVARSGHL